MFQFVGYSQNNYWTVSQTKINSENTVDQPLHFKQYTLDATNLLIHLKKATTFSGNSYSKATIELPNEKGELIKFRIYEKSNFAPELAAKYPEIKSFIGISEKNKYTANISYSPYQGLNVAILNPKQSTTLIKPTIIGGNTYIVFSRNEISKENPFECEDVTAARTNNSALDTRNINDGFLRKYRVAISTTAEFSQFWLDGTETTDAERKAKVIAAINVTLTRINGIFERDFSLTMELISNNDQVVYLNSNTDPYDGVSNSILQNTLDTVIGDANYDVGHLFHFEGTIHGNAGCIACVCTSGSKGSGWTGHSAPDSDNFNLISAHEFGHQFGGWHVQSSSNCRSANEMQEVEPGSGSTIMGYAGICPANVQSGPDDYFNYVDIRDVIQWTRNDSSCAQLIASGNTTPTVNAGNDFTIPKSTPFILEGSGNDADGDAISFCWEENDPENPFSSSAPTPTRSQGPMFRSLLPVSVPNRYMPNIADVAAGISPTWEVLPSINRTMDFVLTVRDNHAIGAQTASDEMTVTVDANAGPFVVTSQSSSETWNVGDSVNLSWNVANTDQAPINCSNVDVFLSIDGGLTYPYTIATNIANSGNASFFLPNVPSTSQGRIMVRAKNNIFYAINAANITIQASEFVMNFANIHEQSCKPNDVVFNFTYHTFLGFNETTTFSVQNLPAGAIITFNPATAIADGTTVQAVISNTSAIALGEHNIIITGTSVSSEKNANVSFTIFDSTIAIPTLTNPLNGETSIDPFGTLNWNSDINAENYTVEIATDAAFSTIVETATVTTNQYQPSNLNYDTTYYWRVKTNNTCGSSSYSNAFSFTTFCVAPSNVIVSNVLIDNALLSWTENGNATSWEIEVVPIGNTPTGIGVLTTTNPYTISGLNSSTEYVVYVRSSCGSGNFSDWISSNSFTTAVDFCSGDHFYDTGGASNPYSNGENYTVTIAPSTGNNTVMVTFNSFNLESGYDYLYVYDGSDINAPLLGSFSGSTIPGPFTSNNPNGTLTFWFISDGSVTYNGWDATVTCLNITCPTPNSFTAQNISYNSLDLSWNAGDSESAWEIEYGLSGFSQGNGTLFQTSTNPQSITGLNPNTTYDFYIRANCGANIGDDDSLWVGPITATTLVSCPQPFGIYVNTTYNSAEVSWTPGGLEANWEIEYGLYGFTQGSGTLVQTSSNPYTITGLNPDTAYQVYIRANCGANIGDDDSNWNGPIYFYTQSLPGPSNLTTSLDQNTGNVTLNWDAANYNGNSDFETYYIYRDGALVATSVFETYTDNLPIYGNYYYYVRAKYNQGESYSTNTEYVLWESCPTPSNLIASNETVNSVDLTWDVGYSETAWEIEYGNFGFNQGTGTYVQATTNPFTLSGLNHSTKYDVYLRANCGTNPGDDDSNWIGPITFSTLCSTFTAPYIEDVEAFNGDYQIENCWLATPLASSGNYTWNIASYGTTPSTGTGPSQANSGSTFFFTEASNGNIGDVAELITPTIDLSNLTVPQLSFYYHMYGSNMGSLHVDVLNNGNWTNDVIIIDGQQQTSGTSPWVEQALVLNAFTGNIQIRFRGIRGNSYESDIAIDDIKVIEAPTCPQPSSFTQNNITASTVELSWTNGNTETNWEIEYGNAGFSQGTGTTVAITTNPYTLTNLNPLTDYDVYIRAICGANPGDDDSTWVGPITFTTLCGAYLAPFEENFANYSTPNCWSESGSESWIFNTNAAYAASYAGDHTDGGGTNYAWIDGSSPNGASEISTLSTPMIDISNLTVPLVSFSVFSVNSSSDDYNTLDVELFDGTNWNSLLHLQNTTGGWKTYEYTLTGFTITGDIQLRFTIAENSPFEPYNNDILLDDIKVVEAPTCPQPTNFTENNVTASTVDLSWTNGNTETNWEIEYGNVGFTQGTGTYVQATTNPFTLTGLNPLTDYDVYLRAICGANPGDDDSIWVGPVSFSTICNIYTTPFLEDVEAFNGDGEIENCWSATPLSSSSNYSWRIASYGTTPSSGTGPSQANSGSTYFYTEASNGNTGDIAELITPTIDISNLTVPQLSFYYHMYGVAMGSLHVDVLNNGNWTNDLLIIDGQQQTSESLPWIEQVVVLNAFTGSIQIRFRGIRGFSYKSDMAVDDIKVIEAPTCPKPTNFNISSISFNNVDLSWSPGGTEATWEIEYGLAGFTLGNGVIAQANTNPFTLTGLNEDTNYDVYIRANCGVNPGEDDSVWAGPLNFKTYKNYCNGQHFYDSGGEYGSYSNDESIVTTIVPSDGYNTVEVIFNYFEVDQFDSLKIYNGPDVNSTLLGAYYGGSFYDIDFPDSFISTHPTGALTFWFTSSYSVNEHSAGWDATVNCLDISCFAPTKFSSINETENSVDLIWTPGNLESNWEIEYGLHDFVQGTGTTIQVDTNSYTILGLEENTCYDVYLRSNCDNNSSSAWIKDTFTTLKVETPNSLVANLNQTNGEVTLNWNSNSYTIDEDFDDGYANFWNFERGSWYVYQSVYYGSHDYGTAVTSSYYPQIFSNYIMKFKMRKTSWDGSLGVYFNGDPSTYHGNGAWENTYSLEFCNYTSANWKLSKIVDGVWITIKGWTNSNSLIAGPNVWNDVKIVSSNGTFDIYFNNVLTATFYDDTFTSGVVGLMGTGSGTVNVDDFTLIELNCDNTNRSDYQNSEENNTNIISDSTLSNKETESFNNYNIYRDGMLIATSFQPTYTDLLPSYGTYNYYVSSVYDNGESNISNNETVVWSSSAGINDLAQFNFTYYPNPFENSINLKADENFTSIKVFSLLGQELMNIVPDNTSQVTIDTSKLSIGTYFMKVEINGKLASMKIIKK